MPCTKEEMAEVKDAVPDTITFNTAATWVMRIKERKIEVNPDVEVTEAAQAVLDALAPMLKKQWVGLTGTEINHILAANVGYPERIIRKEQTPLTLKEIFLYALQHTNFINAYYDKEKDTNIITEKFDALGFARAIERAHRIGEEDGEETVDRSDG